MATTKGSSSSSTTLCAAYPGKKNSTTNFNTPSSTSSTIPPSLAVIVLNWNNYHDTSACISSLKASDARIQIIVVDNHSSESLREITRDPAVHLIRTEANLGYAGGNNVGIRYALEQGFPYIAILNNDLLVMPDFLSACLEGLRHADIVSGHILYPNGETYAKGGAIDYVTGTGRHLKKTGMPITFMPGCAIITKAEVLRKTEGFDERYFLYYEDTDWSARAAAAGFSFAIVNACATHKVAATTGRFSRLYIYYMVRNQLLWIRTHIHPLQRHLITYPLYLVRTIGGYTALCLLRRQPRLILEIWRALRDFRFNRFGPGKHLYKR
ncbi:MAG TPA: glycosyltransferase family 2 protein [Candidatus Limnocylindrales bacterium]|nr:glycosyltransferase family 2 protein [Candidatus Limnocylindrales bacterium]